MQTDAKPWGREPEREVKEQDRASVLPIRQGTTATEIVYIRIDGVVFIFGEEAVKKSERP